MVCSKCHQHGHNSRSCPNQEKPVSQPSIPLQEDRSRSWTTEEDQDILLRLQDPTHSWDYPFLIQTHNTRFNKERTEHSYKLRMKKIAQENNISLKTNNHWTEEEKASVVIAVRSRPLHTPWEEISTTLQRSEHAVKTIYHEQVTPLQHIDFCLQAIQPSDILQAMSDLGFTCLLCTRREYSQPFIWQNNAYCESCFLQEHKPTVDARWRQTQEYAKQTKKTGCNLCGRHATFDQNMPIRFHYDHLDMFNKSESICEMVKTGVPMDDIYREMDKCQLLCISCHKIVTKMEHLCGFVRLKKQMEDTEEKRQEYSAIYQRLMTPIYQFITNRNHPLPPGLASSHDEDNTDLNPHDESNSAHPCP